MNERSDRPRLWASTPVYGSSLPGAERINRSILEAFATLEEEDFARRTHFFRDRFENLYLERGRIPKLEAVRAYGEACAREILGWGPSLCAAASGSMPRVPGSPPPSTPTKKSTSCSPAFTTSPFPRIRETSSSWTGISPHG